MRRLTLHIPFTMPIDLEITHNGTIPTSLLLRGKVGNFTTVHLYDGRSHYQCFIRFEDGERFLLIHDGTRPLVVLENDDADHYMTEAASAVP